MIREVNKDDLEQCAGIIADCLMWDRYERTMDDARTFVNGEFERGTTIWVYEDKGEVVGFIACIERGMMGEFPFVRSIAVHRDHRGKGVGTKLLAFAEERMFVLKPLLFMMVSDFNVDAQRLYRRLGYIKIGTVPDYKKRSISEYMLMKRIDAV